MKHNIARTGVFLVIAVLACSRLEPVFGTPTATLRPPRMVYETAVAMSTAAAASTMPEIHATYDFPVLEPSSLPGNQTATTVSVVPTVVLPVMPTRAIQTLAPQATPIARVAGNVTYGIHVLDPVKNSIYAQQLGVSIVKLQVRWADMGDCTGINFSVLDSQVAAVSGVGMRVLLSVVTAPSCSNSAGSSHLPPDNLQAFADFNGSLASRYGGSLWGIEVWNEENLDREWGVPDPVKYVEMLRVTYQAVKAVNPAITVIAGAPAPTWHNPPVHWDDIVFYQSVAQAGGGQYVDCVGAHVNALTFPPSAKSSEGVYSVNGNTHHSWYFYDTVWGYYNAFGGVLPICLTEFGVATPGAIGGLPTGFEWAQKTTLDEQASWLIEGMKLAEQWGIVKALIVWNLDFSPLCGGCVDEKSPYSILAGDFSSLPAYHAIQQALGR